MVDPHAPTNWQVMFNNRKERGELLEGLIVSNKDTTVPSFTQVYIKQKPNPTQPKLSFSSSTLQNKYVWQYYFLDFV